MQPNPYLPAIEDLKSKISAKELEISPLRQQLASKEAEMLPLKEMVNRLCDLAGQSPFFVLSASSETATSPDSGPKLKFRPDQFFNKELSEAAVEYLTAKKNADLSGEPTPATADEIYSALTAHGYTFNGISDSNNKSALKTALTRNTAQVAKIKDDLYGLRKWYGMRAKYKSASEPAGISGIGAESQSPNITVESPTGT